MQEHLKALGDGQVAVCWGGLPMLGGFGASSEETPPKEDVQPGARSLLLCIRGGAEGIYPHSSICVAPHSPVSAWLCCLEVCNC